MGTFEIGRESPLTHSENAYNLWSHAGTYKRTSTAGELITALPIIDPLLQSCWPLAVSYATTWLPRPRSK